MGVVIGSIVRQARQARPPTLDLIRVSRAMCQERGGNDGPASIGSGSVALGVGLVVIISRPGRVVIWAGWALGTFALAMGAIGVLVHVISNCDADLLDDHDTATWRTMGEVGRWWLAAMGGVGPTPPLAPASLSFAALLLLLAGIGVRSREATTSSVPAPAATGLEEGSPR